MNRRGFLKLCGKVLIGVLYTVGLTAVCVGLNPVIVRTGAICIFVAMTVPPGIQAIKDLRGAA